MMIYINLRLKLLFGGWNQGTVNQGFTVIVKLWKLIQTEKYLIMWDNDLIRQSSDYLFTFFREEKQNLINARNNLQDELEMLRAKGATHDEEKVGSRHHVTLADQLNSFIDYSSKVVFIT